MSKLQRQTDGSPALKADSFSSEPPRMPLYFPDPFPTMGAHHEIDLGDLPGGPVIPMQRVLVQSLVRKLRFYMPRSQKITT